MDNLKLINMGKGNGYRPVVWIKSFERERAMSYVFNLIDEDNRNLGSSDLEDCFAETESKKVLVLSPERFLGEFNLNSLKNKKERSFDYNEDIKAIEMLKNKQLINNNLLALAAVLNENEFKGYPLLFVEPNLFFNNEMYLYLFSNMINFKADGSPIYVVSTVSPNKKIQNLCYEIDLNSLTLKEIKRYLNKYECKDIDKCAEALLGLTYIQMLQTIEYVAKGKTINEADIHKFKSENFDTSMLEVSHPTMSVDDMGGYKDFKDYVKTLPMFYTKEAHEKHIKSPKGFIAFGVPGCSKTVSASIIANTLNVPLVNINLSKIMQGLVGSSESNMEQALNQVKQLKYCVLLLDESEKLFGGYQSSLSSDGGTLSRVMSRLLTFLHENENTFTIFTSNDITKLPPELLRAGRIDSQWYFPVPNKKEAKEILDIYLAKYDIKVTPAMMRHLTKGIDKFTGAEIEQTVINLQRVLFLNQTETLTKKLIEEALSTIVPVTRSSTDAIRMLEEHARRFAVYASKPETDLIDDNEDEDYSVFQDDEEDEAVSMFK